MTKRLLFVSSIIVLMITGIVVIAQIGIKPTDKMIIEILEENRDNLLSIVGIIGAGIARDTCSNNHIIGITIYLDNMTENHEIPNKLGDFTIFIKGIDEASKFEIETMIIQNTHYHLLDVTTDKPTYNQNDNITITIKNFSNETFTFSNSIYNLYFEKWIDFWELYTGIIGLEVITYLSPEETGQIIYKLGEHTEKSFQPGKYQVVSKGWLDHKGKNVYVWDRAEFMVEYY